MEFDDIVKAGRTHLQDAMPIRLGQEFTAYAGSIARGVQARERGGRLPARPRHRRQRRRHRRDGRDGIPGAHEQVPARRSPGSTCASAPIAFSSCRAWATSPAFSAQLRVLAIDLSKIASDLRLMVMGPRTGIDEITLPAVQPGSSIMPGKINPSIPEMVNQVCFQVMGCDTTVAIAAEHGQLELNVMMPVIAHNVLLSMRILTNAANVLADKCVKGIEANREMCEYWVERSAALATALAPQIGYAQGGGDQQAVGEGRRSDSRPGEARQDPAARRGRRGARPPEDDRDRRSGRQARRFGRRLSGRDREGSTRVCTVAHARA